MSVFLAICVRAFALQSRFGVAAGAATRALRCARFSATAPLRDCDRRLRTIMVGARCKGLFAKAHRGPSPGKGKGPFGRAGLSENLRPGGEPGLTQGGGVRCLILGGAPVRTALG